MTSTVEQEIPFPWQNARVGFLCSCFAGMGAYVIPGRWQTALKVATMTAIMLMGIWLGKLLARTVWRLGARAWRRARAPKPPSITLKIGDVLVLNTHRLRIEQVDGDDVTVALERPKS